MIYFSKKEHYTKYFNQYSNNIKKVWIGIKIIINIKTKDQNSPYCIEVDNQIITDNKEIYNNFNDYFSSVADKILLKDQTPIINTLDTYMPNPNPQSFVFEPSTPNEVYLLIDGLTSTRAQDQMEYLPKLSS